MHLRLPYAVGGSLFALCFLATPLAQGQTQNVYSIGAGSFFTTPKLGKNSIELKSADVVLSVAPFAFFNVAHGRFNASVGVGHWNSTAKGNFSGLNFYDDFTGTGFNSTSGTIKYDYSYVVLPVIVGADLVAKEHFKFGVEAVFVVKYLYKTNSELHADSMNIISERSGAELAGYKRPLLSSGIGLFTAFPFGRATPKLGVGYVGNQHEIFARYTPYALICLSYRLTGNSRPADVTSP